MLNEIKREWKRDKAFFVYIMTWFVFVISFSIAGVFLSYHNWYLNTPERIADPLNWIWGISVSVIYILMRWWGSKLI
jgi:uncharacterized membrane protein (DUF485 family)